jgi:hypothetical protein
VGVFTLQANPTKMVAPNKMIRKNARPNDFTDTSFDELFI